MNVKSILVSWTFWFNVLAGLYELCQHNGLVAAIPPPWDQLVIVAGNILLRFKTNTGVALFAPATIPPPAS